MRSREKRRTTEAIITAIKGSGGIKVEIARRLGVSRVTVAEYIEQLDAVREAYEQEVESLGDAAEAVVLTDIVKNRNIDTAKWYLMRRHKKRGYGDKEDPGVEEPVEITDVHFVRSSKKVKPKRNQSEKRKQLPAKTTV